MTGEYCGFCRATPCEIKLPVCRKIAAELEEFELAKLEAEVAKLKAVIAMRYATGPPLAWILAGIAAALLGILAASFLAGKL